MMWDYLATVPTDDVYRVQVAGTGVIYTIHRLGSQGWEMIGMINGTIYFKRRLAKSAEQLYSLVHSDDPIVIQALENITKQAND